jgi:hypothetical protein
MTNENTENLTEIKVSLKKIEKLLTVLVKLETRPIIKHV